jgi:hypothetical protein
MMRRVGTVKAAKPDAGVLRAGAAEADITPAMGIELAGDIGRYRIIPVTRFSCRLDEEQPRFRRGF